MHSSQTPPLWSRFLPLVLLLVTITGCSRFNPKSSSEYVYVVAKETFLRDRIAAVSNKVANVTNGQRLAVVERSRRFLKVKTEKGEIGWIEEHGVVDQDTYQQFDDLQKEHANDPVIATATLRDDLYLHVKPGRQSDRFYLLPENDKLQMLVRASVPKVTPPQAAAPAPKAVVKPKEPEAKPKESQEEPQSAKKKGKKRDKSTAESESDTPPMEDWWLVRDSQGKVGWMLSRRLDIDLPDTVAGYAEGQRMVGAYLLTTVDDPESKFPNQQAPEYVTVLSPYKDGLPYDFDQVRVFTWNVKKHRYETAYRQRDLQGYLPVKVGSQAFDKIGTVPVFSIKTGTDDTIAIDPATGAAHAANLQTVTYRLEGAIVRKVEPPSAAPPPPPSAPTPTPAQPAVSKKAEKRRLVHTKVHHKHPHR